MEIGVLALQGAFQEHRAILEKLGAKVREVRQVKDLDAIKGLVLPGGESTVQGKLLHELGLFDPLQKRIKDGLPILATCAGLILLAQNLDQDSTQHLATLPVTVKRNAFGRQSASFQALIQVGDLANVPAVFIRAPYITQLSPEVQVLARVEDKIVAVAYQNQIGLAFHPELSLDDRIHQAFLAKVAAYSSRN